MHLRPHHGLFDCNVIKVEGINGLPGTQDKHVEIFPQKHSGVVPNTLLTKQKSPIT